MTRGAVVYLTRTGVMEPLGQSQILPYLRGISAERAVTLLSREKAEDLADGAAVARIRAECRDHGIDWRPRPFLRRSWAGATAWDVALLALDALAALRQHRGRDRVLHARSYLPSFAAMLAGRLAGVPFVFDMRALWPEELVTAGRVRRGSLIGRVLFRLERLLLGQAAAVVVLTAAAERHLRGRWPRQMAGRSVVVIPTCVDLDRFQPRGADAAPRAGRVHGVVGSLLTGWFRTDWLQRWFAAVAARDPAARFDVITRDPADAVRAAVDPAGALGDRLAVRGLPPAEMPKALQGHDLSVFFYAGGEVSELGRSPTRMAEVLACGLPVVTNAGIGDVAEIVNRHRVGVLLDGADDAALDAALRAFEALLADPDLPRRCRAAAEAEFSLAGGTVAYLALYRAVTGR